MPGKGKGKCSGGKRQNGNSSSSRSVPCNGQAKDEKQIFQSTKDHDKDEILKLRELNQKLIKIIDSSRQEFKAGLLHRLAEMESQLQILQATPTNFESRMNKKLIQEVKIGEQLSNHLKEVDRQFRQQLAKRDEEYEAEISKAWQQLQEAEERFKREISKKEEDCRAMGSDKQTLETSVLQLTDKIKVISEELEAARKAWELEKNGLFSQIVAAQKQTTEIAKCSLSAEQAWNVEKENILSSFGRTYEKKIEDIFMQKQKVLLEKMELECQLNDSKAMTRELLENFEDNGHLWETEKQNLQCNVAELQTKIDSMASEGGLLCQKNIKLSREAESLKAQLNEYKARLAQMEDESVQNDRVLRQCRTENFYLQSDLNDSKGRIQDLLQKNEEDMHLWDAEKSNLEGTVAELKTKHECMASEMGSLAQKNRELTVEAEFIKYQGNALQSELNESKKKTQELLQKSEVDQRLWDEEKSTFEGTLAELQTKHDDLMLQSSRSKALEEELLSTMSCLEEMKESTSKGEALIANLKSQLLAVAEEKDGQLSDVQKQLSAMTEEKMNKLACLQDELSSIAARKKLLEEENKSLQTEFGRRKLALEEEKVRLEGRVRELQTTFNSVNKELESSRTIAEEKERKLVDLQNRHWNLVEAKNCLQKKNDYLHTELNRSRMVSEENARLQNRVRQLETSQDSLNRYIECKNIRLRQLKSELQPLQAKPLVYGYGKRKPKPNGVLHENGKLIGLPGKQKQE